MTELLINLILKFGFLKITIKEFKLERNLSSRSWPKWLSNV